MVSCNRCIKIVTIVFGILCAGYAQTIIPTPKSAQFPQSPVVMDSTLWIDSCASGKVRAEFRELVNEFGIRILSAPGAGDHAKLTVSYGTSESAAQDSNQNGPQGYTLQIAESTDGVAITIHGGDEAGAFYAIQTLRQLLFRSNGTLYVQPSEIADWPLIKRRGLIMGRAAEGDLATLQYCKSLKLNYLQDPRLRDGLEAGLMDNIRRAASYCDSHFIEYVAHLGYQQSLVDLGDAIAGYYTDRYNVGMRSFTANFDDQELYSVNAAHTSATAHSRATKKAYDAIRSLNQDTRFIVCPVPYGGRPSTNMTYCNPVEVAIEYLNTIGDSLPDDVALFWTGDEHVFSDTVSVAGAMEVSAAAKGKKVFLWDNNGITFANGRLPIRGREKGLGRVLVGYTANVYEGETSWNSTTHNVEYTLASIAMFTWASETYSPSTAAVISENYVEGYFNGGYSAKTEHASGNPPVLDVQAYPNPFNPTTKIAGSGQWVTGSERIKMTIYNIQGELICQLPATSCQLSAGITWDASGMPSGMYIVKAMVNGKTYSKRITLMK